MFKITICYSCIAIAIYIWLPLYFISSNNNIIGQTLISLFPQRYCSGTSTVIRIAFGVLYQEGNRIIRVALVLDAANGNSRSNNHSPVSVIIFLEDINNNVISYLLVKIN